LWELKRFPRRGGENIRRGRTTHGTGGGGKGAQNQEANPNPQSHLKRTKGKSGNRAVRKRVKIELNGKTGTVKRTLR